jgi:restriction system protein
MSFCHPVDKKCSTTGCIGQFYMSKAGLVESPRRGRFVATTDGRALLARNPARIDVDLLQEYPTFLEFYRSSATSGTSTDNHEGGQSLSVASPTTPEEQIEAAHSAMQLALRADLLQRILQNSPNFFEEVIRR